MCCEGRLCLWKVKCLLGVCKCVSDAKGEEARQRCVGKWKKRHKGETVCEIIEQEREHGQPG